MIKELSVKTSKRTEFIDITHLVEQAVRESKAEEGVCYVFVPHTTAGITINENADRSVADDIKNQFDRVIPFESGYAHAEGNSAAHIKSSIVGSSTVVLIENNRIKFGTWQGVFFCEFDGPRSRKVICKVV